MVLYLQENSLRHFALFFALVPHLCSNFLLIYWMKRNRTYNIYISRYVNHYDWLLITLSVVAGFYNAVLSMMHICLVFATVVHEN